MKIAIGTTRKPKVEGVQNAISQSPYFTDQKVTYVTQSVESGVSDTPLSFDETMKGAKNRAQNMKDIFPGMDYFVGVEGGLTQIGENAYIFGCIYIENAEGVGHFGFSPLLEVPENIRQKVYTQDTDLGQLMGEISGKLDMRSENGSMGMWSDDTLTRSHQFTAAFQAAIAPFFNQFYRL